MNLPDCVKTEFDRSCKPLPWVARICDVEPGYGKTEEAAVADLLMYLSRDRLEEFAMNIMR